MTEGRPGVEVIAWQARKKAAIRHQSSRDTLLQTRALACIRFHSFSFTTRLIIKYFVPTRVTGILKYAAIFLDSFLQKSCRTETVLSKGKVCMVTRLGTRLGGGWGQNVPSDSLDCRGFSDASLLPGRPEDMQDQVAETKWLLQTLPSITGRKCHPGTGTSEVLESCHFFNGVI